ncbi:MAG: hypothetical protein R2712_27315 [Vicinamibacterales bacterium]
MFVGPSERSASAIRRDRRILGSAGVRGLVGFHAIEPLPGEHEALRKLRRLEDDGIAVDRADALAAPLLPVDDGASRRVEARLTARGETPGRLVAIGIGTRMRSKLWPANRFIEIGARLVASGHVPVVMGGASERASAEAMVSAWGKGLASAGCTASRTARRCWRRARRTSVWTPVRRTWRRPSAAARWCSTVVAPRADNGPAGGNPVVLRHMVPCEGCLLPECPVNGHPCMHGLDVDRVWHALAGVLGVVA